MSPDTLPITAVSAPKSRRPTKLLLRARLVVPVSQPVLPDGGVLIEKNRIAAVGRWRDLQRFGRASQSIDLGDVLLMPGLIDAHCHLDYSGMAGYFAPPKSFTDWIKAIMGAKAGWSKADFLESWTEGARQLLATGTTTVADAEAVPELLPVAWNSTPLRVLSFLELIGLTARRDPAQLVKHTAKEFGALKHPRCRAALSPHATYSTIPELLRLSAAEARRRGLLLMTHVAESATEFEMFTRGKGEMHEWIKRSSRDMSDCDGRTPVEHLHRTGLLGPNLLAVHANYLGRNDAQLLGRKWVSVAHCPRSHFYFRHAPFPYERLRRAGVNICLGTDSLASVCKPPRRSVALSMFEEMRAFASAHPKESPRQVMKMATVNGARALNLAGKAGELALGAFADLIAIPFAGKPSGAYGAILAHTGNVGASIIDGTWAVRPA